MRIDRHQAHPEDDKNIKLLPVSAASAVRGFQLYVFPEPPETNSLEIINIIAGGETYPIDPNTNFFKSLLAGPDITNAIVQVRASGNFYNATSLPIAVVVTPDNGPSTSYTNIFVRSGSPTTNSFTVTIPSGTTSAIHVWTLRKPITD